MAGAQGGAVAGWQERNAGHEPHQLVSDDASALEEDQGEAHPTREADEDQDGWYARTAANRPARQEWDMDNLKRLELQVREVRRKGAYPHGSGVWFGNKAISWHTFHRGVSHTGHISSAPSAAVTDHTRRKSLTASARPRAICRCRPSISLFPAEMARVT